MIRLFAAIAVPEEIADPLARRQQPLPGARWRPLDSLHITLRFFGEVREDVADDLDSGLSVIAATPFALSLEGAGAFGEGAELRSLWAGVAESEPLTRLAARCESAARKAGLKPEPRAFRPHVTLAYLRAAEPARIAAWIQGHNLLKSPPFAVGSFGLYSSWRTHEGSVYRLERAYGL